MYRFKKVKLPAKMKYIPEKHFMDAQILKVWYFQNRYLLLKQNLLQDESLKKFILPIRSMRLEMGLFKYSGLKSIHLNKKVQFIGNSAFAGTNIKKSSDG